MNTPITTNPNTHTSQPRVLSSTSIIGTNVYNRENKSIGEIKDLMIDLQNGEVQYAVLSFGGFLGMGDKLFAIPLASFTPNGKDETMMLDINKERLEKAPGFDKDHWPASSDHSFVDSVYTFYGHKRRNFNQVDPRLS